MILVSNLVEELTGVYFLKCYESLYQDNVHQHSSCAQSAHQSEQSEQAQEVEDQRARPETQRARPELLVV